MRNWLELNKGVTLLVADGDHTMFIADNDAAAKAQVTQLLREGFGWKTCSTSANRDGGALQNPAFNLKIVR